tara:strand:+ start:117 stop:461 length:345 start_codon:yes stop_codon:yes gene_type:complete
MVQLSFLETSMEPIAGDIVNGVGAGAEQVGNSALQLVGNPTILIGGIILIVLAIVIFYFLKKIIINSVLGVAAWLILTFVFQVDLPFIPSLAISIIFGLAGIGAMLVLKFFAVF